MTTPQDIETMAREDADEAIQVARESGSDPIAWITGNSYMPPIRAFGHAEEIWQSDDFDAWVLYVELFEEFLTQANVYLGSPEYDNALYVVDLARFEFTDETEGEFLQDEWIPVTA